MTKYIKKVSQQVPITMTLESLQELFYPIGSIVQSATLDTQDKVKAIYGGNTWEKIRGRFLLGQSTGDGFAIGSQGGQKRVTLTVDEMPSHTHEMDIYNNEVSNLDIPPWRLYVGERYAGSGVIRSNTENSIRGTLGMTSFGNTTNTGGGQPHENMPPFEVVYIWKRTA